jgi:hypothetical protein
LIVVRFAGDRFSVRSLHRRRGPTQQALLPRVGFFARPRENGARNRFAIRFLAPFPRFQHKNLTPGPRRL